MRGLTISIFMCSLFAFSCSSDDNNANNGSNNGVSNNGVSNNGVSNNGKSNNGTTVQSNNGMSNNGQTSSTNNGTSTATNNSTGMTLPSVSENCAEAELTECFLNFDCQETEVCRDISDNATEIACCVTGTRGTKTVGEECTGDDDSTCDSGICIGGSSEKFYCSASCELDAECPDFMKCISALGICAEGERE